MRGTGSKPTKRCIEGQRFDLRFFHGLPKFRLTDLDISAGPFFPSKRLHGLGQSFGRRPRHPSSPTAFEAQSDAQEDFREPAFAGP